MARITIEECLSYIPNRFELTLAAAYRARQLANGATHLVAVIGAAEEHIEETTSTSSINVTIVAEQTIKPIEIGGWKPEGVARDAIQSLITFWQGFVNFLIKLFLLVLPVLITILAPIALVVWGIIALVKRQKRKKAAISKP